MVFSLMMMSYQQKFLQPLAAYANLYKPNITLTANAEPWPEVLIYFRKSMEQNHEKNTPGDLHYSSITAAGLW